MLVFLILSQVCAGGVCLCLIYLLQRQCDETKHKADPRQSSLCVEKLVPSPKLHRPRTPPRLEMREDVLEVPQHVPVPLHKHAQLRRVPRAGNQLRDPRQRGRALPPRAERVAQPGLEALAVDDAVPVVAAGGRQDGRGEVLVGDDGKGDLLEGLEGELVVEAHGGDVDVAAAGEVALGVEVHAHGLPEVGEDVAGSLRGVEPGGHDLHAYCIRKSESVPTSVRAMKT
jgi:hypothetical protein